MTIYMMVEPEFADYPACRRIQRGIYEETLKKRIEIQTLTSFSCLSGAFGFILLIGVSEAWINLMSRRAQANGLYPIALSNRVNNASNLHVSSVMMDIYSSMQLAIDYLHSAGRYRLALFGVNPNSSSDPWRAQRFLDLTGSTEDVFYLQSTMEDLFYRFYACIGCYDGVICANDYAAVSLVTRLKEIGYDFPKKLYILGCGDRFLSRLSKPSISSISDDYENFGRAALSICSLVEKNRCVSVTTILLHSELRIRETTENRPFIPLPQHTVDSQLPENHFFRDQEVSRLAKLEMLLSQCDPTDYTLLRLLDSELSYAAIAQQCFLSETAAKYRVRKMQTLCGVSSRKELVELVRKIF